MFSNPTQITASLSEYYQAMFETLGEKLQYMYYSFYNRPSALAGSLEDGSLEDGLVAWRSGNALC